MTRRATNLNALEPEATAQMNVAEIARFGLEPGDMVRVTTRRGTITIKLRADNNVPQGMIYIPFAYVEAAANLLTNPKLDPFGKIPEFKFCAARVEPATDRPRGRLAAAE
jgi:formate dehydrogenase major subunit